MLSGLIFLHRISDKGLGHTALSNLCLVQQLCGSHLPAETAIVTSHWDTVDAAEGTAEETRLLESNDFFGQVIAMGGHLARIGSPTNASVLAIADSIASRRNPMPWQIEREMAIGKTVAQTDAGLYLCKLLRELRGSHTEHIQKREIGLQAGSKYLNVFNKATTQEIPTYHGKTQTIEESIKKLNVDRDQLARRQKEQHDARESQRQHDVTRKTSLGWANEVDDPWWPCILSMDGGGVRGYSTLFILKHLMHEIWELEIRCDNSALEKDLLPCHYFDFMCKFLRAHCKGRKPIA